MEELGLDLKGIVWIPARRKYRVLLTRRGVEYVIGHYLNILDAVKARDAWLVEYSKKTFYELNEPPKYTKEWFKWKHQRNVESMRVYSNQSRGIKLIIVGTDYQDTVPVKRAESGPNWENLGIDPWAE